MSDGGLGDRAGWPRGIAEHRLGQAGLGLRMSPAERLRWLKQTVATLRRWQGRATVAAAAAADGPSAGTTSPRR